MTRILRPSVSPKDQGYHDGALSGASHVQEKIGLVDERINPIKIGHVNTRHMVYIRRTNEAAFKGLLEFAS